VIPPGSRLGVGGWRSKEYPRQRRLIHFHVRLRPSAEPFDALERWWFKIFWAEPLNVLPMEWDSLTSSSLEPTMAFFNGAGRATTLGQVDC
jgi:hypothetical protein